MEAVSNRSFIYAFSKEEEFVKKVPSGTTIEIETLDAFQNQITTEDTRYQAIDWKAINPATGPIYIDEAMPGDILKVKIEKIEVANQGVMAVGPNLGVLGEQIENFEVKLLPIEDGHVLFNDLKLNVKPMIGVIGVAPKGEAIPCGTPGDHGGNMDNKLIGEGATLYFPVATEGALFALGDMHAVMGDGEIGVTGVEVAGKATVTLDVIKGSEITTPWLENNDVLSVIVSAQTLEECVKRSVEEMVRFIVENTNYTFNEATMLLSATANTEICQVVDPLMTTRLTISKDVLSQLGIRAFM